jgi:hypothetical protein
MVHVSSKILTIRLLANTSPLFPHSCTTRSIHPTPTIGRNASRRHGAQATARSPKPNLTHACHSPPSLLKRHRAAKATEPQSPPTRCHVAGSDPPWLRAELHPPSPKTPPPQLEQYGAAGGPSVIAWQRRCGWRWIRCRFRSSNISRICSIRNTPQEEKSKVCASPDNLGPSKYSSICFRFFHLVAISCCLWAFYFCSNALLMVGKRN